MMPITATLACVASAAMAGVPLLNGFCPRKCSLPRPCIWMRPTGAQALPVVATVAGMFSVAYSLRFTVDVFFGPKATDLPQQPHEPPHWMRVPVELLVLACLVAGILPAWSVGPFLNAATPVVGGTLPEFSLAVWHGVNTPLIMSFVALAGGIALYRRCDCCKNGSIDDAAVLQRINGKRIFDNVLARISLLAKHAPRTDHPPPAVADAVAGLLALLAAHAAVDSRPGAGQSPPLPLSPAFLVLWVIGCLCAWARPGRPSTTGWPLIMLRRGPVWCSPSCGSPPPIWH
jgi:multicomponent K+:H+ antiporter subunit A